MKNINLLKEGHGLRYTPPPPASEKKDSPEIDRSALVAKRSGPGKAAAVLAGVILLAGGLFLAYKTFGPLTSLADLKSFLFTKKSVKPPVSPEAAKPSTSAETKASASAAPLPPAGPAPALQGVKASELKHWYRSDREYPFAVVVASFRKEQLALEHARRLTAAGHASTVAPTDLGEKGRWFRVVLDRYSSIGEARDAAVKLRDAKPFESAWATRLPFAVELGEEADEKAAESARSNFSSRGIVALVFPEAAAADQPVTFRLLAGAFSTKQEATAFSGDLGKSGLPARVVTP